MIEELNNLIGELVAEAEARNRRAANVMYEALWIIAQSGDPEAIKALKIRNSNNHPDLSP